MEERGAKSVHILDPSSGAFAKRFATIQVFVFHAFFTTLYFFFFCELLKKQIVFVFCLKVFTSADQSVQPKAAIIFRGTGARISKLERAAWDPRVRLNSAP